MRFAIALLLVSLVSACYPAPHHEDVVGIWRADNGSRLIFSADGSLRVERFDWNCWEHNPSPDVTANGTWEIREQGSAFDRGEVELLIESDHRVLTTLWYGGPRDLLCVVGDPDSAEYVHFYKQDEAP